MKPELPNHDREQQEAKITALLLGELNAEEAAALRKATTEGMKALEQEQTAGTSRFGIETVQKSAIRNPQSAIANTQSPISISALWLDGFGELTPQELSLLAALAPCCQQMTLAFCVDAEQPAGADSWLSIWSDIAQTRQNCWKKRGALAAV